LRIAAYPVSMDRVFLASDRLRVRTKR